jgi:hypothetical protein
MPLYKQDPLVRLFRWLELGAYSRPLGSASEGTTIRRVDHIWGYICPLFFISYLVLLLRKASTSLRSYLGSPPPLNPEKSLANEELDTQSEIISVKMVCKN